MTSFCGEVVILNKADLRAANKIQAEIEALKQFLWSVKHVRIGKLLSRTPLITFKSASYGIINSCEYEMDTTITNKVIAVLMKHLESLESKLDNL